MALSSALQGSDLQEIRQQSHFVFVNGFAMVADDSNDPPEVSANTPPNTIHYRARTNGSLSRYNFISSAWESATSPTLEKYSDVSPTGENGTIFFTNDDSPNGDSAEGVAFRVNNTLLIPALITA